MGRPLRVLIIEDSEEDTQLLLRELGRDGYEVEFERVETAEAMQSALAQKTWDLIISDYTLPAFNVPNALAVLRASGLDLPFIIMSGSIGEDTAVAALKAGAHDFLIKGNFARLGPAIERELREAESRRERRQAEAALKSSETRYRLAASATNDVIWEWDSKTNELMWSENAQFVFGYMPEEIKAQAAWWDEHIHPEDRERVVTGISVLLERDGTIWADEYRFLRRDGSIAYIVDRASVARDSDGKPLSMIGAMSDITERKQAEDALRESEEKFKTLFNSANDAIFTMNHTIFLDCNATTEKIFRCSRDQIVGHSPVDFSPEQQPDGSFSGKSTAEKIEAAFAGEPQFFEWLHTHLDGTPFYAEVSLNRVSIGGEFILQAIVRDITERKHAEEEIKKQLDELQRWHNATLGRETRVLDLKRELNELLGKAGQPPRYPSAE